MKRPVLTALMVAASMFAVSSCGKKDPAVTVPPAPEKSGAAPVATTPAQAATAAKPEPKPAVTVEEIAGMIGHAADMPKDFESAVVIDAGQIKKNLKASAMWKQACEVFDIPSGVPEEAPAAGQPVANEPAAADAPDGAGTDWNSMFDIFTSGRITLATGPGTATQSLELLRLINIAQRVTTREALIDYAQSLELIEEQDAGMDNPFTGVLKDKYDPIVASLEKMAPPVVWIAIETKGKEDKVKAMLAEWDSTMSEGMPPFVQKSEKEIDGGKFVAFTIKAQDVISLDDLKESLAEDLPVEKIEKLHAVMASKQLAIGFGVRKESLMLFLAPSTDALKFAASPAESMAARPEFEFLAEAKGKSPFFVAMSTAQINGNLRAGVDNGYYADVLEEVLGKITAMGDLRDVIALVNKAGSTMRDLTKGTDTAFCGAGWMENGVRFEALGGADSPDLDGTQPLAFAGGLASEDTVLSVHSRVNPVYTEKALDLLEDLSEIAYELGHRYAASEPGKEKGMNEQFVLFRDKMLPHVSALWKSLRGQVGKGVGQESAMIMDLGAAMPKFPGVPEALASKGRIPRIAVVYPVTDRAKLQDGWKAMQPALKGLLEAIPMPEDKKLNLPDAFTSEKDGLKTYFYGFSGITNDDFMPSVSVSDKFFFISSSKNLSEMLVSKLATLQPKPDAPRGLTLDLRIAPVVTTSLEWLDLVKANAQAVFPAESAREEFLGNEADIRKGLEWAKAFDGMSLKRSPEGARWRTSVQFKMKGK